MLILWDLSCILWLVCPILDTDQGIWTLSRLMANLGPECWRDLKWLLRYLEGTLYQLGMVFKNCNKGVILKGFIDAEFAGNRDNGKTTSAYMFTL